MTNPTCFNYVFFYTADIFNLGRWLHVAQGLLLGPSSSRVHQLLYEVTVEKIQYVAPKQDTASTRVPFTAVTAFEPPCHYCQNNHALESCGKIQQLAHKDRTDFLRNKGLCYGCLTPGHMIKTCKKRIQCKTCSLKHPQIPHIEKVNPKDQKQGVVCPPYSVPQQTVGFTGAGAKNVCCQSSLLR